MALSHDPPLPGDGVDVGPERLIDPETGQPVPVGDKRTEFERLSRQTPRDPAAERAFIESKIEMVRSDPRLSDAEKQQVIEELRRRLE
jgi:hypothetical protein